MLARLCRSSEESKNFFIDHSVWLMHCLLEFQLRYSDVFQEVPLQSYSSADLSLNNGWCFDVNFIGGCSVALASMMGISRRIYPQHYLLIHIKENGQSKCG